MRISNSSSVAALCLAFILAGVPFAPVSAQTAKRAASGAYNIAGRLLNATTGEPVRRATIAALAEEDNQIVATTETDSDGHFSLPSLPAAKYPLTASKRGFRTAFYDEHDNYNSAIVTGEGQDTTHLVFRLVPGAVLHGVVTGDGGDPVENASVMLFRRPAAASPDERITQVESVSSDDTGAYEFSNLAAGEYLLAVKAEPWFAQHGHGGRGAAAEPSPLDVVYPVTYYDSTIEEASAAPIVLASGSREEADVMLQSVPSLHLKMSFPSVTGRRVIPHAELRQTVFGVQVSAESASYSFSDHAATVEFDDVAPGHYELTQGNPPRVGSIDATASQDLDAGLGTSTVSVTGTVRAAGAASLPEDVELVLERPDSSYSPVASHAHKGQFHLDAVPPGLWNIVIAASGQQLPVVGVTAGTNSTTGDQVRIEDRPVNLLVTVSRAQARIQGFAKKDGRAIAGAMIVLVPRDPRNYRALVRRDQSDSDGSFSLRDVPSGQYTVIAIDGWKIDWQSHDAIARYLPFGVSVTITDRSGSVVSMGEPVPVSAP